MVIYALYGAIYHKQLSHFVFFLAPSCDLMQGQQKELCAVSVFCVCVYTMCVYVLCVLWGANCSWAATAKQQQNQQQQWLVVVCKSSFKINADCRNKRRSEQLTWNQSKGSTGKRSSAKAKKTKWWGVEDKSRWQRQWQNSCSGSRYVLKWIDKTRT